jgi:hypothetical protein
VQGLLSPVDPPPADLRSLERQAVLEALAATAGNRKLAAERLGMPERTCATSWLVGARRVWSATTSEPGRARPVAALPKSGRRADAQGLILGKGELAMNTSNGIDGLLAEMRATAAQAGPRPAGGEAAPGADFADALQGALREVSARQKRGDELRSRLSATRTSLCRTSSSNCPRPASRSR